MPSYRRTATILLLLAPLSSCLADRPGAAADKAAPRPGAKAQVQVRAIVLPRSVTANLAIETAGERNALIVRVKNGTPPYRVTLQNAKLATVTPINATTFWITGTFEGKTVLEIRDSSAGRISCDLEVRSCLIVP